MDVLHDVPLDLLVLKHRHTVVNQDRGLGSFKVRSEVSRWPLHVNCGDLQLSEEVEVHEVLLAEDARTLPPPVNGGRLDDQLNLRHAEPILSLSHPEASSLALSLSCRSESSNKSL